MSVGNTWIQTAEASLSTASSVLDVTIHHFAFVAPEMLEKAVFDISFCIFRYLGKEGWAPASYLKKAKDDLPSRKKNLTGPVEIIGNIMEISNLLNKKSSTDKETQAENETSESHITKKEISLPILCNDSNGNAMMTPDKQASKLAQGSPAVARIAPQRAQISKAVK